MQFIILGAGKPAYGKKPSALKLVSSSLTALDWQIRMVEHILRHEDIHFIAGYHAEEMISRYPELNFSIVPDWDKKTVIDSLFSIDFGEKNLLVQYSDTIFREDVYKEVFEIYDKQAFDIVFGIDSYWKNRYDNRDIKDIQTAEKLHIDEQEVEFTGLLFFSKKAVKILQTLKKKNIGSNLIDLIDHIRQNFNLKITHFDVKGKWTELNSSNDIAKFILGTKADTLARLERVVKKSIIGKQYSFTVSSWKENGSSIIQAIQNMFNEKKIVVRSSSKGEDSWKASNAGGFESILNVDVKSKEEIIEAIEKVIQSYKNFSNDDQVLIQEFLSNVKSSGVIFTCGLESGSPYYRINYDDKSSSTESVTSGSSHETRTVIVNKVNIYKVEDIDKSLVKVLEAVKEIEELLFYDKLDIEFAIDSKNNIHIFQVRPITVDHSGFEIENKDIVSSLKQNEFYIEKIKQPNVFQYGKDNILANMPDWNPAEIIGIRPKPLAFSLYRELITNSIWAQQREEFGYQKVNAPLIVSLSGQPYVDVRASFNSFIPNNINSKLKEKLVNIYLDILKNNQQLHDKIEFDIVFTIWIHSFKEEASKRFNDYNINEEEILELEDALKALTKKAFFRLDNDITSIEILQNRYEKIISSDMDLIEQVFMLLQDCKKYGTKAFAHAARAGFVATTFLKNMVLYGVFSSKRKDEFLQSFRTVAGEFEKDKYRYMKKEITLEELISKYGHLRPGTYEITNQAYWENPTKYFAIKNGQKLHKLVNFQLNNDEKNKINDILSELQVDMSPENFMDYLRQAIQAREYVKFVFTKSLSKALDLLVVYTRGMFDREELSFMEYEDIELLKLNVVSLEDLKNRISQRKNKFLITQMVELPSVIVDTKDIYRFEKFASEPNFVTKKTVEAEIVFVETSPKEELEGKIVVIPQADPGFDWLFGYEISGLITKYGGANSHMAIRAAEIGLPAAIGVGDKLYEEISKIHRIRIDCANKIIQEVL